MSDSEGNVGKTVNFAAFLLAILRIFYEAVKLVFSMLVRVLPPKVSVYLKVFRNMSFPKQGISCFKALHPL